jgi:hypothetical protein
MKNEQNNGAAWRRDGYGVRFRPAPEKDKEIAV